VAIVSSLGAEVEKSNGQKLLEAVASWISGYVATGDKDLPLVLALWCVGSWVFDRFYAWPFLAVTAAVKGAGKSRVLELVRLLVRRPWKGVGPSPAFILRRIAEADGRCSQLWDEAETRGNKFFSEVINSGYRRGDTIGRASGASGTVEYRSYSVWAFALIGDLDETARGRSIVMTLERGRPAREYLPEVAEHEGQVLSGQIQAVLSTGEHAIGPVFSERLDARDREIWGSMLGLANWLGCDVAMMARLENWAINQAAVKTEPRRRNEIHEDEQAVVTLAYGERAVRDVMALFVGRAMFSADIVGRLRAMSPWGVFRGGLTAEMLASLVSRHGLAPRTVKVAGKALKGYQRADVVRAFEGLGLDGAGGGR